MEPTKESTVVNPPATAAEPVPHTPATIETATTPATVSTGLAASATAPEVVPTPEPATTPAATAARSAPVEDPMAIIPADAPLGPPPQYDDHHKDAISAPEPAFTVPKIDSQGIPIGQQVPPSHRVIPIAQLGEEPRWIQCRFCYHEALTRVQKESTSDTTMAAACCCLFGGLCCAFIPYCFEMCHDSHHFCTNCGAKVAVRPHEGPIQEFYPGPAGPVMVAPAPVQQPQSTMDK
ncbi:LPS-induced tumor necrosis factor alpha factor, partial [Penicillium paradoxum]|uniref:LPS-induced tumor necrosis factor alpha factor n=1 Tax=Penicillium paradoxum TaxID=176176 RepID=UPI0025478CB0